LDRGRAISLFKEMVTLGLVQQSFVSVEKNKLGSFSLIIKPTGNISDIRAFLSNKNLVISESTEKGMRKIYKP
jgi:tRNA A22 N-methylase